MIPLPKAHNNYKVYKTNNNKTNNSNNSNNNNRNNTNNNNYSNRIKSTKNFNRCFVSTNLLENNNHTFFQFYEFGITINVVLFCEL